MERDAAPILEFHDFDPTKEAEMVADMHKLHTNRYTREENKRFFNAILKLESKEVTIRAYLERLRQNSSIVDLASVMTEERIQSIDSDIFEPLKYWFYKLCAKFNRNDIEQRYNRVKSTIIQRRIDAHPERRHLIEVSAYWMEFHEFDLNKKKEIIKDAYRYFGDGDGIDCQMSVKVLENIHRNPSQVAKYFKSKTGNDDEEVEELMSDGELASHFRGVARKYPIRFVTSNEQMKWFVKEAFTQYMHDLPADKIKARATEFYTRNVVNGELRSP